MVCDVRTDMACVTSDRARDMSGDRMCDLGSVMGDLECALQCNTAVVFDMVCDMLCDLKCDLWYTPRLSPWHDWLAFLLVPRRVVTTAPR